jgi:hypothetical protein
LATPASEHRGESGSIEVLEGDVVADIRGGEIVIQVMLAFELKLDRLGPFIFHN